MRRRGLLASLELRQGLCLQPPAPLRPCERERGAVGAVLLQGRRAGSEMREMDIFLFNTKIKKGKPVLFFG